MDRRVYLLIFIAAISVYATFQQHKSGRMAARGVTVDRDQNPFFFKTMLVMQSILAIVALGGAIALAMGWWRP